MNDDELKPLVNVAQELKKVTRTLQNFTFTATQLEQFQTATRLAEQIQLRFQTTMLPLASQITELQKRYASQISQYATVPLKRFYTAIDLLQPSIPNVTKQWAEILQKVQQWGLDLADFILLLTELGWAPAFDVPVADIRALAKLYRVHGAEAVREPLEHLLLIVYDNEVVQSMLLEWVNKTGLAKRMSILRDIVDAHLTGKYSLSVPVMMAQVEGMIADAKQHKGRMKQKQYKTYIEESTEEELLEMVSHFVTQYFLQSFEHGDTIPEFSRNAILHGADCSYGTQTNSLKTILLFHYLQERLALDVSLDDELEPA